MKALIIGASGQIARAIGERLLRDGWGLTCAQRGDALPELLGLGAKSVQLDRDDPVALRGMVGAGADVLIDTVAYHEGHAATLLEIQDVIAHYIIISSASVYCDDRGRTIDEAQSWDELPEMPIPISETQQSVAPGPKTYSTKKIALERTMLDQSRSKVTIIRPCAIYGPNSKHPREWWFLKRILDGRRFIPLQREQSRFQTSATPNIAEVIFAAIRAGFTGILNAGDPDSPSVREIGEIISREFRWDGKFVSAPLTADVGGTPWSVTSPFVLSMEAATRLGYQPVTTYREYAPLTCRWLVDAAKGKDWRAIFPVLTQYPQFLDYLAEDAFFVEAASTAS